MGLLSRIFRPRETAADRAEWLDGLAASAGRQLQVQGVARQQRQAQTRLHTFTLRFGRRHFLSLSEVHAFLFEILFARPARASRARR